MERSILFKSMVAASLALPIMMGSCKKDDKAEAPAKPKVKVESITLDIHDTTIFANENFMLTATILPADADTQDVDWSSQDDSIASVISSGKVYAEKKTGTTYIIATSRGGNHKDSCKVTVIKNIEFKDANLLAALVKSGFNTDGDDGISPIEAKNINVKTLDISGKKIASFDELSYFTNLEELICSNNQIASLDLSKLTNLKSLSCENNKLSKLDISKNSELTTLICNKNQLDTLDIRENKKLADLFCGNQANALKLELTIDQFNTVWKENGTDTDNKNVEMVMNFFDGAVFHSDSFEDDLKNGDSFSFNSKKKQFNFRLLDSEGNELSFYDNTVLRQIVWTSSDESVATISADFEDGEESNTAQMTVKAVAAGNTVIKGTVNDEYTISFNLEVK